MNWHKDLAMATTAASVIDLVNEYLDMLPQVDAHIPAHLRPAEVTSAADVQRWHCTLTEAVAALPRANLLLQDLCVVFVRAAARIAELSGTEAANGQQDSAASCG
jgi:hypothetical protein